MPIIRTLVGGVAAVALAAGLTAGLATTASAADGACNLGYVCGWQNPFFEAPRNLYTTTPTDCVNTAAVVQSITNATGRPLKVWSNSNCTGASDVVDPNQSVGNFSYTIYSVSNA
ncbi:MAG: peptidase inhibitor family I36 protein [Streptomycetaceae bacterium]|nr:peptidase inhibitor family I36 protein [Streptomycetaceae bacterium]